MAQKHGLNSNHFTKTILCESQFNASAVGDDGMSVGAVQIALKYHPDISRKQALDGEWAIEWMGNEWDTKGVAGAKQWSCWRLLKDKYGNGEW